MNKEIIDGVMLKKMLAAARQSLKDQQDLINSLNVFPVPDGDTGTNMSLTMEAALREAGKADNSLDKIMELAANGSLMGARGNSGVILSQLFRGFAKGVAGKKSLTTTELALAMKSASETAYKAVMKPTEGTILTVARESAERAMILAESVTDHDQFLQQVIVAANASLERTPELLKVLKDAGVVDSGGKGLVAILEGAYNGLTGKTIVQQEAYVPVSIAHTNVVPDESLTFGYCTEFIIHGPENRMEDYRKSIQHYGDSTLVVGNGNVIKVHIHTNHPGKVMETAMGIGHLSDIKIDNMRLQHRHKVFDDQLAATTIDHLADEKKYGMVTVAMGEGITKIFKDFTVDVVIQGGQTMNPSTEDFMKAIDAIDAKHIFIMPNNSNIIMAANQAKTLSKKEVTVIPTETVPQGISAVLAFSPEAAADENQEAMLEAIELVRTGQVTYAVRDTVMNGHAINKGAIIGLADKEILSSGQSTIQVATELIKAMTSPDDEILTVYYGEEVSETEAVQLEDILSSMCPDLEIEVYYGGQPLYYYIVSLE